MMKPSLLELVIMVMIVIVLVYTVVIGVSRGGTNNPEHYCKNVTIKNLTAEQYKKCGLQ